MRLIKDERERRERGERERRGERKREREKGREKGEKERETNPVAVVSFSTAFVLQAAVLNICETLER